ncbi:MAG: hypothetical protein JNL72_11145 [Flavipsychrobacter sp.]|nr:hypothetical protein [Flavipsychrobacter sp.]
MKKVILSVAILSAFAAAFSSCKKDPIENPVVEEGELITTLKVTVTDSNNVSKSFVYKVENGFGSSSQGTVQIDTFKLAPNYTYSYVIEVLNESETPVEDITAEVLSERDEHLFLLTSAPATGAGSLTLSNGSKDNQNLPFNQSGKLTSGAAGSGSFTIALLHEPTNKNGATTAETGGETDAEATFPVAIQ